MPVTGTVRARRRQEPGGGIVSPVSEQYVVRNVEAHREAG